MCQAEEKYDFTNGVGYSTGDLDVVPFERLNHFGCTALGGSQLIESQDFLEAPATACECCDVGQVEGFDDRRGRYFVPNKTMYC